MFNEDEATALADVLMDYDDGTPEYDSAIQKLLAARDPQQKQDFTNDDLLVMLDAIKEYDHDTAELLTPSYDSPLSVSFVVPGIVSEREAIFRLRERILQELLARQIEL